MRHFVIAILISAFVFACNNAENNQSTADADSTVQENSIATPVDLKAVLAGCYSQIYERDTSSLQIQFNNDSLTGDLVYKLFEKDRNDGMFKGELKNDVVAGWYYFKSEGIMSVREVVWKITNNQLWPAMGEMKIRNDTMIFSEPSTLKFDSTHPFVKVNCAN